MPNVRITLAPTATDTASVPSQIENATVRLSTFGAGKAPLELGEKKPAELLFRARFLPRARDSEDTPPTDIARLCGELERRSNGKIIFHLSKDWEYEPLTGESEDDSTRFLALSFDSTTFADPEKTSPRKLRLPAAAEDCRHLELGVEFTVGGNKEAGDDVNDVLDLPIALVPSDLDERVRIKIGLPYANTKLAKRLYKLTSSGEEFTGVISANGEIILPRKLKSGTATLEVKPFLGLETRYSWELDIGSLAEIEEVEGVQSRLNGLGFMAGPVDGDAGLKTQQALRAFQHRHALLADGTPSDETKQRLKDTHAS